MTASGSSRCIVFVAPNTSIDRLVEVDRLAIGGINRPDRVVAVAGGKGLNAARAASTLGGRALVAAIVAGQTGDWIARELEAAGIEASLLRLKAPAETRTCVSILDRSTGRLTEVYEPGGSIEPGDWSAFEDLVTGLVGRDAVGVVAMSGSLPRGSPADGYARIVSMAHGRGAIALVDTYGEPLKEVLAAAPDVVKLNAEEASAATGVEVTGVAEAARAAGWLLERGARAALVTVGAAGATLATADGTWSLAPPPDVGPYTVGSGDSFLGGVALTLAAGAPMLDAAVRGMAAAAANSRQPGPGRLDPGEAERAIAGVRWESR